MRGPLCCAVLAAALTLTACSGDSSSGGGTANSQFVGTYRGTSIVRLSTGSGTHEASNAITIFVNRDGLVQVGNGESTIFASGPLSGDSIDIEEDVSALVDAPCTGTISLSGSFSAAGNGAVFQGQWVSQHAACAGNSGSLSGVVDAERASDDARASRVFQTSSPALQKVFRHAGQ